MNDPEIYRKIKIHLPSRTYGVPTVTITEELKYKQETSTEDEYTILTSCTSYSLDQRRVESIEPVSVIHNGCLGKWMTECHMSLQLTDLSRTSTFA